MDFNWRIFGTFVFALILIATAGYKFFTTGGVVDSSEVASTLSNSPVNDDMYKTAVMPSSEQSTGEGQPVGKGFPVDGSVIGKNARMQCIQVDDRPQSLMVRRGDGDKKILLSFRGFSFECELLE